jgi:hypothetical protein
VTPQEARQNVAGTPGLDFIGGDMNTTTISKRIRVDYNQDSLTIKINNEDSSASITLYPAELSRLRKIMDLIKMKEIKREVSKMQKE